MDKDRTIGFEIRCIANLIKRDFEKRKPKELESVSGVHGFAMNYFFENRDKDVYQKDFEVRFSIRRSTATKMLQLMEKNGLIVRKSVESDARLKKIVLTEKAVDIHNKVINGISESEEKMKAGISEEELETFINVCEKIKKNLEDKND